MFLRAMALGCLALLYGGLALADGRTLPIHIQADSAVFNDQTGISVYSGHVRIAQGETVITADKVTVHAPNRRVERLEAEGTPVHLRSVGKDGRELNAEARRMRYFVRERRAELLEQARLWQGEDEFRGNRIVYDLARETLDAAGSGQGSRVEVILSPQTQEQAGQP